jgi:hypothetical protein
MRILQRLIEDARTEMNALGLGLQGGLLLTTVSDGLLAYGYSPRNVRGFSEDEIRSPLGYGVLHRKDLTIPGSYNKGVLYWVEEPYVQEENLWGQIFEGLKITGPALLIRKELAP